MIWGEHDGPLPHEGQRNALSEGWRFDGEPKRDQIRDPLRSANVAETGEHSIRDEGPEFPHCRCLALAGITKAAFGEGDDHGHAFS